VLRCAAPVRPPGRPPRAVRPVMRVLICVELPAAARHGQIGPDSCLPLPVAM
jgi:hypothetical protein